MSGSYLDDPRYRPQPSYPQYPGVAASYPMQPAPGWPAPPPQQPGSVPALARYRTALAQKQQLDAALQSAGAEVRADICARCQGLKTILAGEAKAFLPEEETVRLVFELDNYISVLQPPAPQPAPPQGPPSPQAPIPPAEPLPPQAPGG